MQKTILQCALNGERLTDIPIIDNHGHFMVTQGKILEEEVDMIVSEFDNCGINKGVVFVINNEDYVWANDCTIRGTDIYPERFIKYATVSLNYGVGSALKELERCRRHGMVGLKLFIDGDVEHFRNEKFYDIWNFCGENHWPVIIHGLPRDLPEKFPNTNFIGAHQIEYRTNDESIDIFLNTPNYYWDTATTMCAAGAIEQLVTRGAADKLLFGSDYPVNDISVRLATVLGADINDDDMKKILGGNIMRLLNIDGGL